MKLKIPISVSNLYSLFKQKGYDIYIVGGAVRDTIMGKSVYDWDFTTNATPEQMLAFLPNAYYTNNFGTVGLPAEIDGEHPFEITTYRTEHGGYSDGRRPDNVRWGDSLEEDLARRDFTINAMALTLINYKEDKIEQDVEIIDPFLGKADIDTKMIRTVGDPHERFSEDGLRLMRAVRIASEIGFTIESSTFNAIKTHAKLIDKISRERVKDELFKLLASDNAYEGILLLRDSGLLYEILPEMEKAFGIEQKSPGRHHIHDVGTHLLLSLKNCQSTNPVVRFATLIHDIGKPQTYRKNLQSGLITFYNHEVVSASIAKRIARRLRFSNNEEELLWRLVRWHQFTVDERQTDTAIRRFIKNVGKENVNHMIALRVGDRLGGGARETSWRLEEFKRRIEEVQLQPFSIKDLKITGHDVMEIRNIAPGKEVGEILTKIFALVENKKIENDREVLIDYVKTIR
jgi:tRNA nucleotidyltransferase (CCA-adding enzyme)